MTHALDDGELVPASTIPTHKIHDALFAANIEYAGLSCNGVNLFGDSKSIDAARRWMHEAGTLPAVREAVLEWKSRWEAERADHDATIKHADKMMSGD